MKRFTKDGSTYEISLLYCNNFYGRKSVYHIHSNEENYPRAKRNIAEYMEQLLGKKEIWFKGLWEIKNEQNPCIENGLHAYYEFSYDEENDVYVYTYVEPYDD